MGILCWWAIQSEDMDSERQLVGCWKCGSFAGRKKEWESDESVGWERMDSGLCDHVSLGEFFGEDLISCGAGGIGIIVDDRFSE